MSLPALVLVGGHGTRLRPLTLQTPKPLVPICNVPLLQHLLEHLHGYGITRITLAIATSGKQIRAALGDGGALGLDLRYTEEQQPLGSGGAIANATADWTEPFLVLNGDIITDLDLDRFIAAHQARDAEVSIALQEVEDPSQYGAVALDPSGRITKFAEKPPPGAAPSRWINAGVSMFSRPPLGADASTYFHRIEDTVFPRLADEGGPIFGYLHRGHWLDVGTLRTYQEANFHALSRLGLCPDTGLARAGAMCLADTRIDPSATITGPVLLGSGTVVHEGAVIRGPVVMGRDCVVRSGAVVDGSILWDRVRIAPNARIEGSIIATGATVGDHAQVRDAVLPHGAVLAAGSCAPAHEQLG